MHEIKNTESIQTQDSFLEPDDLLQNLNDDLVSTEVENERFARLVYSF